MNRPHSLPIQAPIPVTISIRPTTMKNPPTATTSEPTAFAKPGPAPGRPEKSDNEPVTWPRSRNPTPSRARSAQRTARTIAAMRARALTDARPGSRAWGCQSTAGAPNPGPGGVAEPVGPAGAIGPGGPAGPGGTDEGESIAVSL